MSRQPGVCFAQQTVVSRKPGRCSASHQQPVVKQLPPEPLSLVEPNTRWLTPAGSLVASQKRENICAAGENPRDADVATTCEQAEWRSRPVEGRDP